MTGLDLRVERTKVRMSAEDVARHMGVTRTRVTYIERLEQPTAVAIARYLAAITKAQEEAA